jgi:hypothetical protein
VYYIASHIKQGGFDAAYTLPGIRGICLHARDLGAYCFQVLDYQVIGAHLLSPFTPWTGDSKSIIFKLSGCHP